MRTKTRVVLSIASSFAISVLVIFYISYILRDIKTEVSRVQAYNAIEDKIEALNLSLARLSSHPEKSRILQIESILATLENLLGLLQSSDARQQLLIRQIRTNAQEVGYSFEKLISSTRALGEAELAERREVLLSNLWMKTQFISDDTSVLTDISQARISAAQQQASILILALVVGLVLVNAAIYFFSGRSLMRVKKSLRDSEERLRLALDSAYLISFEWDIERNAVHRLTSSEPVLAATGERPGTFEDVLAAVHPEDREVFRSNISAAMKRENGQYESEFRLVHPDGKIRWLYERGYIERDVQGRPLRLIGLTQDITERKDAELLMRHLNEILERQVAERTKLAESRAKQLQTLAVELIEAEERERQRITRLLHEDLQQVLAAARFQLQALYPDLPPEPMLASVVQLLDESITKSRRLSHELSPPVLYHADLIGALKWLIEQVDQQFGLQVHFEIAAAQLFENAPLKFFIFRAVQELLFNIVKHAGVKRARVIVSALKDRVTVTVSDQGGGFNPDILKPSPSKELGLGLLTIRERASYVGGDFLIESAPGKGSRFTLTVPFRLSAGSADQPRVDAAHQDRPLLR